MGQLRAKHSIKNKIREVMFTDQQMLRARDSGKFADHRAFIKWLYKTQHKLVVTNYEKLIFQYIHEGKTCFVRITGTIGDCLTPL